MQPSEDTFVARCLRGLARAICRHPRWFLYPQLVLFLVAAVVTVRFLEFSTNRDDLVGADKPYHRNFLDYKENFRVENEIVAVAESEDPEKNRQFVERLGARLLAETNLFSDVLFNNDVKMLGRKALLFFPEDDLLTLEQALREYRPFLDQFVTATNLPSLFQLMNRQFRGALRATDDAEESLVQALPALRRMVDQAAAALVRPGVPPSPGIAALFDAGPDAERRIYITFDDGRLYLAAARPSTAEVRDAAVHRMRELVEQTRREVPGINAAITGEQVLEVDEMAQSQRDTARAAVLALILVALIFIFGYREAARPLKATACLLVGLVYTLAYATLAVGHLNILTITFVPMLIGLAIDFGVHLVTRYEEELRHHLDPHAAIEQALVHTGQGIFTGCLTTAAAFFAMGLTDFRGIEEMGIICGGGLLICLVPMMTLLPVLMLRGHHPDRAPEPVAPSRYRARLERLWLDRPGTAVGLAAALSLLAGWSAREVGFDYNLLNLQSHGLPAVELERKLIESADRSVLYCAVISDSLEEANAIEQRLQQAGLDTVSNLDSMAMYLTEDQASKLEIISRIKAQLEHLPTPELDLDPVDIPQLSQTLWSLQGYLGLGVRAAAEEGADPAVVAELQALRDALGRLRRGMLRGDRAYNAQRLGAYQRSLFADVHDTFAALRDQDDREPMRIEDLPPVLRHRFVSHDGTRHVIQVYPRDDIWQRTHQLAFIQDLRRTLDPGDTGRPVITGTPVQLLEYTTLLKDSYVEAAWYALGAIALMVLVHFRSLVCVVLALLPVGLGTLWMVGFMGWHQVPFNPANIMVLPLVVGIGVTSGIHMLNRYSEERSASLLAKSTGKAVLVSALTTIAGFGSLVIGQHQGIASLGYVMAVGTATCMIAALTVLPALLTLLHRAGWAPTGKTQWRNRELVTGLGGTEVKTSTAEKR
jgi:uncharacterized protein